MIQRLLPLVMLLMIGCSDSEPAKEKPEDTTLSGTDQVVTISTQFGDMHAILYDETPQHKANFLKLINQGFYNDLLFHRVIDGFMIQGGDPDSKTATAEQRLGMGGPGYTVPAEIIPTLFHRKGALSAARQPDQVNPERASSGSQFYIVHGKVAPREKLEGIDEGKVGQAYQQLMRTMPESDLDKEYQATLAANPTDRTAIRDKVFSTTDQLAQLTGMEFKMAQDRIDVYSTEGGVPFLDDQYTVFGRVISGLEVIDQIAAVQTGTADRPVQDVRMNIKVEEMPKSLIIEKYGDPYKN